MRLVAVFILVVLFFSCKAQTTEREVGGPCEGCEALYEYGDQTLSAQDTLPYFTRTTDKLLLTGTVYMPDGRTPANGVIIYAYHTDEEGIYVKPESPEGWESRHGFLRGWVITDEKGAYSLYTNRPASYPNTRIPQHIHLTIKEKNTIPYYIDAVHFIDDPALTQSEKSELKNRGGSGLVDPKKSGGLWIAKRNIILGKNIPNY